MLDVLAVKLYKEFNDPDSIDYIKLTKNQRLEYIKIADKLLYFIEHNLVNDLCNHNFIDNNGFDYDF